MPLSEIFIKWAQWGFLTDFADVFCKDELSLFGRFSKKWTFGKSFDKIGSKNFANLTSNPASSAIYIMPLHKTITGNIDNISSKASAPLVKILSFIFVTLPVNNE